MAGESTNPPPSGPGANSGGPPINDQGAARPNPAPPPPPSVPPVPNNTAEVVKETVKEVKDAKKVLEEFEKKQKEVNQAIEAHKASLERIKTLNDEYRKATEARKEAEKKAEEETKKLTEQFAQHKKEDGTWQENTEAAQKQYQEQLQKITDSAKEAAAAEEKAKTALVESVAAEQKSKEEAEAAMKAMEALRDTINGIDQAMAGTLEPVIKKLSESLQAATKETADFRQIALADLGQSLAGVAIKGAKGEERIGGAGGAKEGEAIKNAKDPGIYAAVQIGKALDDYIAEQKKMLTEKNPQASAEEIEKMIKEMLSKGETRDQLKLRLDRVHQEKIAEINKKHVEEVMKEKEVDEATATKMVEEMKKDKSSEIYKELKKLTTINTKTQKEIKSLSGTQLEQLMLAQDAERKALEEAAEKREPEFIDKLVKRIDAFGDAVKNGNDFLKSILKGAKDDNLIKTLLVIATVAIGATLGYIWSKIKLITTLVGAVLSPLRMLAKFFPTFGKAFSSISGRAAKVGGFFGKMGGGIMRLFSKMFGWMGPLLAPLKAVFGVVTKLFPSLGAGFGFLSSLGPLFMKSFKVLGPIGVAITTLWDAISGATKGFKEMGWKGIIMGAIAGILSGLTFGLLDFKTIFDALKKYFGKFFESINGFVNILMWVAQPIIKAVKNIMNIFQGEGSIMGKIFKSIWELIKGQLVFLFRFVLAYFFRLPMLILKALGWLIVGIGEGLMSLVDWLIDTLADAILFIYNWFASGQWKEDIEKALDEIVVLLKDLWHSFVDALGDIPWIGDAIKGALGGGSEGEEELSTSLEKAADTANNMVNESAATREAVLSLPMETAMHPLATEAVTALPLSTGEMVAVPVSAASGSQLAQASAMASTAQIAAGSGAISAAINAPTTTVVGGGGGDSAVIMPSTSRNNDPTFRALLFLEQPAL